MCVCLAEGEIIRIHIVVFVVAIINKCVPLPKFINALMFLVQILNSRLNGVDPLQHTRKSACFIAAGYNFSNE